MLLQTWQKSLPQFSDELKNESKYSFNLDLNLTLSRIIVIGFFSKLFQTVGKLK